MELLDTSPGLCGTLGFSTPLPLTPSNTYPGRVADSVNPAGMHCRPSCFHAKWPWQAHSCQMLAWEPGQLSRVSPDAAFLLTLAALFPLCCSSCWRNDHCYKRTQTQGGGSVLGLSSGPLPPQLSVLPPPPSCPVFSVPCPFCLFSHKCTCKALS